MTTFIPTDSRSAVRRFFRQPGRRRVLFVEAWLTLALAKMLLRFFSFRRLTGIFSFPLGSKEPSLAFRAELREDIRWAIEGACRHMPGQTTCFPRGIAAQVMCRRRGLNSIMYYGARVNPDAGLEAHVWVQDGGNGIVGHIIAGKYDVMARFPS